MNKAEKQSQGYVITRVMVALIGLALSLIFHELFHIAMHWGHINHISFFPKPGTLVEINAWLPPGYDLEGEEIVAYAITLVVILITTIIVFKIGDSEDKRSSAQILFPEDTSMQKLSPNKMLELSGLDEELEDTAIAPAKKPRRKLRPRK